MKAGAYINSIVTGENNDREANVKPETDILYIYI